MFTSTEVLHYTIDISSPWSPKFA